MTSRSGLVALAVASTIGHAALAVVGDLRLRPATYLSLYAAVFVVYLFAARSIRGMDGVDPMAPRIVLGAAVLFRLILAPTAPVLSDDIHRYVWEGRLQVHGISPYRHAPEDPRLEPLRDASYESMNNRDLSAIYPPLMQWVFALAVLNGPSLLTMKLVFIAADIALILLLMRLLRVRGRRPELSVVYAWNPLVVIEVAGSGHNDPLGVLFLIAATIGIIENRRVVSTTMLGLSSLCKLFPLALAPFFVKRAGGLALLIPVLMVAAAYAPYLVAGDSPFTSLMEYAERWRFNESLFAVIEAAIDLSRIAPIADAAARSVGVDVLYAQPHMLARGVAATIVIVAGIVLLRRQRRSDPPIEEILFHFTAITLLLHPTLHPWYLLWLIPWLVMRPSPAWILLTVLVPVSYLGAPWGPWVEYVPFYALLAGVPIARRLRERSVIAC